MERQDNSNKEKKQPKSVKQEPKPFTDSSIKNKKPFEYGEDTSYGTYTIDDY